MLQRWQYFAPSQVHFVLLLNHKRSLQWSKKTQSPNRVVQSSAWLKEPLEGWEFQEFGGEKEGKKHDQNCINQPGIKNSYLALDQRPELAWCVHLYAREGEWEGCVACLARMASAFPGQVEVPLVQASQAQQDPMLYLTGYHMVPQQLGR